MKNIEIEYELTYLSNKLPDEIKNACPKHMIDIYVPDTAYHPYLRIRKKDDKCEITKKRSVNGDATIMEENTIPLTLEEFDAMKNCSNKIIEKNRYNVYINNHSAEVDVFLGKLSGLVLIDFEFKNEQEKNDFVPPESLIFVGNEDFVAGGMLAGKSYSDIEKFLLKYNYKKVVY